MARRSGKANGSQAERWTAKEGRQALAAWRKSGMTMAAFCRERGLPSHRLSWWHRRLGGGTGEGTRKQGGGEQGRGMVEAVITGAHQEAAVVLKLRGGARIEVASPQRVDTSWVLQLAFGLENRKSQ